VTEGPAPFRLGLVQCTTGIDPAANAAMLAAACARLADQGAQLIATPEMSGLLDRDSARLRGTVTTLEDDPSFLALRDLAAARRVWIAIGSLAVRLPDDRVANRAVVLNDRGEIAATYDKIHLFDVDLPTGERHRESAVYAAGDAPAVVDTPWGRVGLSICYDVRFPALYNALSHAGAFLHLVPAAFTVPTGEAHWHVLLRARAIETGSFVAAAAQVGAHADGRSTYGHSLAIDPWGRILADGGDAPGELLVEIDPAASADARARIPTLAHARPVTVPA
jgi:predicted amidohydrolase